MWAVVLPCTFDLSLEKRTLYTMQKAIYLFLLFLLPLTAFGQQELWPADVNNNGVVNSIDVLYWGIAFGETGPEREDDDDDWEATIIDTLWDRAFPGGLNYAFADCDGNGVVNDDDLEVIVDNFGLTHGMILDDGFANGLPGVDPPLALQASQAQAEPGQTVEVALGLGTNELPVNDFYGISLQMRYTADLVEDKLDDDPLDDDDDDDSDDDSDDDDGLIGGAEVRSMSEQDSMVFRVADDSWIRLMQDGSTRSLLITNRNTGVAELAVTRIDQTPVAEGEGLIGLFTIVIEDIVVGLAEPRPLDLVIDKVRMIDTTLTTTAVVPDSTTILVGTDSTVTSTDHKEPITETVALSPNPTIDYVDINSNVPLDQVELFNLAGQRVPVRTERVGSTQYRLHPPGSLHGVYLLRMTHADGQITKKITFISQ